MLLDRRTRVFYSYPLVDEMLVVNLPRLKTWNQGVISSEKNKLAKETRDTHISYTTNTSSGTFRSPVFSLL